MIREQLAERLIEHFSSLDLPIGVYFVADDGRLLACNAPIRRILKLPLEGPVEASIADFYADQRKRAEMLARAREAEARGAYLEREIIHFRVQGRDLYVEDYCKPMRDPTTRAIVGYVGCLVDVTSEYESERREDELQRKVEELTLDIGRVLHANTSTLVMAQQTLDAVAETLRPTTFKDMTLPSPAESDDMLADRASRLATLIERLLLAGDHERRLRALPATKWEQLSDHATRLRQVREVVPLPEMRLPLLRKLAHEVIELLQEVQSRELPREPMRDTLHAAAALEQLRVGFNIM